MRDFNVPIGQKKKLASHAVEGVKIESNVEYIKKPDLEPTLSGPYLFKSFLKERYVAIPYAEYYDKLD